MHMGEITLANIINNLKLQAIALLDHLECFFFLCGALTCLVFKQ